MKNIFLVLLLTTFSFLAQAKDVWKVVPTEKVCMVTNMVFPKKQIAVQHEGKTYYGCCENCKATLANDPEARVATDPMTGNRIDKATAVIAANQEGSVLYFENKASFQKYKKKAQSTK